MSDETMKKSKRNKEKLDKYKDGPSWDKKDDESLVSENEEGIIKCACGRICPTQAVYFTHKQHCDEREHGGNVKEAVTDELCEEWRSTAEQGEHVSTIVDNCDYSHSTVRKHVRGDCQHGESRLRYSEAERAWVTYEQ